MIFIACAHISVALVNTFMYWVMQPTLSMYEFNGANWVEQEKGHFFSDDDATTTNMLKVLCVKCHCSRVQEE